MRELPILFSAPMVRAILEGRKTVTRRVFKVCGKPITSPQEEVIRFDDGTFHYLSTGALSGPYNCPFGQPRDRLWVRETWGVLFDHLVADKGEPTWWRATDEDPSQDQPSRWRPSIHMPRHRSRITLEVTGVRVERLQDITPAQILAEGVQIPSSPEGQALIDISTKHGPAHFLPKLSGASTDELLHAHWAALWVSINGIESWNANPWVWVVEFKRVTS